jgi:hypothetical protein
VRGLGGSMKWSWGPTSGRPLILDAARDPVDHSVHERGLAAGQGSGVQARRVAAAAPSSYPSVFLLDPKPSADANKLRRRDERVTRCMEIEWTRSGVFAHKGRVQAWKPIVENPRVAAVRKLEDIEFGEWTGVYEVDRVVSETGRRETAQYLVTEPVAPEEPCMSDLPSTAR